VFVPASRPPYARRRAVALLVLAALVAGVVLIAGGGGDDPRPRAGGAQTQVTVVTGADTSAMRVAVASRFDDYERPLACGGVLGRDQQGVAHKTLPCGTEVTIEYRGRTVTVPVIDRGPYVDGREFDLAGATANALGFGGVHRVRVRP
jgi:rare lipoprotein A